MLCKLLLVGMPVHRQIDIILMFMNVFQSKKEQNRFNQFLATQTVTFVKVFSTLINNVSKYAYNINILQQKVKSLTLPINPRQCLHYANSFFPMSFTIQLIDFIIETNKKRQN